MDRDIPYEQRMTRVDQAIHEVGYYKTDDFIRVEDMP